MTRPLDTSPAAYSRQIEALRVMSPDDRLRAAELMSGEVRSLAAAGIRRRHPEYSLQDVDAALAEVLLGPESGSKEPPRLTAPR